MRRSDEIIFVGLAITSSWRNGHASTYRSLIHGLHRLGQKVLFLERDQPWYASNRDAPILPYCQSRLYVDVDELRARYTPRIRAASAVIVGSRLEDGRNICDWVLDHATGIKAFYDIDALETLAQLEDDNCKYLRASQVPAFDMMLSFAGGPLLHRVEQEFGARCARPLYCSVDVDLYQPTESRRDIELGYLGSFSDDRQPALERLLNEPARRLPKRRFAVAGARYPAHLLWPKNIQRIDHMAPGEHPQFYARQRFTLHLGPAGGREAGYSPSARLLQAAACGTPIISDEWAEPDPLLEPDKEILLARSPDDVTHYLQEVSDAQAEQIASAARERVCARSSSIHRAEELLNYLGALQGMNLRPDVSGERVVAAS